MMEKNFGFQQEQGPEILQDLDTIHSTLSGYHPVLIEGPASRDIRDPFHVAKRIVSNLKIYASHRDITKPIIIVTRGDSHAEKGISAITRLVAEELKVKRLLVCIDDHIDSNHAKGADRHDVIYELRCSQLTEILRRHDEKIVYNLSEAIKDKMRQDSIPEDCYNYAWLQEVTKSGLKIVSGGVTVAHTCTSADIDELSPVASLYKVGLTLNLIDKEKDMLLYS